MNFVPLLLKRLSLVVLFIISPLIALADVEIRHIKPPLLDEAHLGKKILCHRPMRAGSPQMKVEKVGDQIVAHNYGHGGSGWTLGPGVAGYVNDLLINSKMSTDLTKKTPITIIGAGALGLFTAYNLYEKGFHNITIVAEKFESLTSHNAGGLLAPVSMDNAPEMQEIIDKIGVDAYKFYQAISEKSHPNFQQGALVVPTYFEHREDSGLEPYVGLVMQPAKDVVLDFGNGTKRNMVAYDDGIFIDTAEMMKSLNDYLTSKKVRFVQKKITSFKDVDSKYVINCSGIGAKELNNDDAMIPVQGHLIMLKDQNPKDLQHMILVYFGKDKTESGQQITRSFYIFPKHLPDSGVNDVGVIGGTFIENATAATPNKKEFDILVQGAKDFYGITAKK